jgi:hypothetical protein
MSISRIAFSVFGARSCCPYQELHPQSELRSCRSERTAAVDWTVRRCSTWRWARADLTALRGSESRDERRPIPAPTDWRVGEPCDQELAVNAWRAPQRVHFRHRAN